MWRGSGQNIDNSSSLVILVSFSAIISWIFSRLYLCPSFLAKLIPIFTPIANAIIPAKANPFRCCGLLLRLKALTIFNDFFNLLHAFGDIGHKNIPATKHQRLGTGSAALCCSFGVKFSTAELCFFDICTKGNEANGVIFCAQLGLNHRRV